MTSGVYHVLSLCHIYINITCDNDDIWCVSRAAVLPYIHNQSQNNVVGITEFHTLFESSFQSRKNTIIKLMKISNAVTSKKSGDDRGSR
jgi:hypothetical protein